MDKLARDTTCFACGHPVYAVICRDGRWRRFEQVLLPAGTPGVWAWRRRYGMEETELVDGYGLHHCPKYDPLRNRMPQRIDLNEG